MKDYIVVRIKGAQYKVSEGENILIQGKVTGKPEYEVLLSVKDGKVSIGKPALANAKLTFKVFEDVVKGEKIDVVKYKAKSRYRKKIGFRSISTKILLEKIG